MRAIRIRAASGWSLAALLAATQLLAFSDRFLLTLVATPLKQAFALSDAELGLLQGSAFALPYALALPIVGVLSDRGGQRGLLLAGVALWSGATLACGLVGGFAALFAARAVLGLGQAVVGPAALSVMATRLERARLGRAVSLLTAGATLGRSFALLLGGAALAWLGARGGIVLPGLWPLAPWQALFVLAVLPNALIAVLLLRVPPSPVPVAGPSGAAVAWLVRRRAAYLPHAAAAIASVLMSQTLTAWAPTFYVRVFGLSPAESGLRLGLLVLIAAPLGHLAGGGLLDRLRRRGREAAAPLLLGSGLCLAVPATALTALAPSLALSSAGFAVLVATLGFTGPPGLAGIQVLTPRRLRGRVSALFLAATTLIGIGTGPFLVGLLNDRVFGESGVGRALVAVFTVTGALGTLAAIRAHRRWRAPAPKRNRPPRGTAG
jgi:MFS family permease